MIRTLAGLAGCLVCAVFGAYAAERSVPGDFPGIQAALDASQAGDTVKVQAGRYAGPLRYKDGVRLQGEGVGQVVVTSDSDAEPVLTVSGCAGGVISGITFERPAKPEGSAAPEKPAPVCLVQDSSVEFTNCEIRGGAGDGVAISGKGTPVFRSCKSHKNAWRGFYAKGPAVVPTLSKNMCTENGEHGICLEEVAGGAIEDNECTQNGYSGIYVTGPNTQPTITRNTCSQNRRNGMEFENGTRAKVEGSRCAENGAMGFWHGGSIPTCR